MNHSLRWTFALAAVWLAFSGHASAPLSAPAADAAQDPLLAGCWRATRIVLHTPEGTQTEDTSGRCTLRFRDGQMQSTCLTTQGMSVTTYRYRIVRPQVYATTMVGSSFRTEMMGSTREYQYEVSGTRLRTASVPAGGSSAPSGPRVETEAARVDCP